MKMTTNPWTEGVFRTKFIELVCIGLNAARTNLNPDGTRRHIRAAIAAGAKTWSFYVNFRDLIRVRAIESMGLRV